MSTIQTINVKHPSSGSNNIVLDSSGNATVAGTLTATTGLSIPNSTITTAMVANAAITPAKLSQPLTLATAQATTSGTSIDFTGIPSWVRRINVMLNGVSTNGTSPIQIQIGAGSVTTTGYLAGASQSNSTTLITQVTTGFPVVLTTSAASLTYGTLTLSTLGSNAWVSSGVLWASVGVTHSASGALTLGGTLDRIRLTTVNGTDTFDAGSVNIMYEG